MNEVISMIFTFKEVQVYNTLNKFGPRFSDSLTFIYVMSLI